MDQLFGWKKYALYSVILYFALDIGALGFNIFKFKKDQCDLWMTGPFIITNMIKPTNCAYSTKDKFKSLVKYKKYAEKDDKCLYDSQIDKVLNDDRKEQLIEGYTSAQLFVYVIVPTVVILGILWWVVSTRASKSEWTFWILIGTVIYTGLSTIIFKTDVNLIPINTEGGTPLDYIAKKLEFGPADELNYRFVASKQDGGECYIEGTMLGTGTHPENQPPTYRGVEGICTNKNIPML